MNIYPSIAAIKHRFIDERPQWFLWVPVLYAIGIASYFSLTREPPLWPGMTAITLLAIGMVWLRKKPGWFYLAFSFLLISLGFVTAEWRSIAVQAPVLTHSTRPVYITGKIDYLESLPHGARAVLSSLRLEPALQEQTPKKIRINLRTRMNGAKAGDTIRVRAILTPPPKPVYPGAYDFSRIAYFQQIGATGYAISPVDIIAPSLPSALMHHMTALRHRMAQQALSILGTGTGGIAAALLVAEQQAIEKKTLQDIRIAGLAHILSVSGLHMALVVSVCFFLSRSFLACSETLALRYNIKKWAAICALLGSFFYLMMTGFPVPAVRAFIMAGLVLFAVLIDRTPTPLRCVAIAAIFILAFTPENLLSPSFQMSFAAVTALIASYQWLAERKKQDPLQFKLTSLGRRLAGYFSSIVFSSLIAGMATAPFSIYHFNNYSSYSILANLLAIPITSFWIMPWAVVYFIAYPLDLSHLVLIPMGWGIDAMVAIAKTIASLPFALDVIPAIPAFSFALLTLGGCWICLWITRWRWWGIIPVVIGCFTAMLATPPDIILDGRGKLFAIHGENGMEVSSRRVAYYTRNIWQQRLGVTASGKLEGSDKCEGNTCLFSKAGKTIAIVQGDGTCPAADMVVNLTYHPLPCKTSISQEDLRKDGTHTVTVTKEGIIRIRSTREAQGKRPWVY